MFSKKPTAEHKPVANAHSGTGSTFSVLGADTSIKGDINAAADLHLDGKVEGDIACATLVQGESGEVVGGIRAECARLSGLVRGTVSARDLVILKSARLHGDVQYDTLTIEQGALVDGHLSPRSTPVEEGKNSDSAEAHLLLAPANETA
jgi:cytoskeletal protein CcmA (bactofilin family)